MSVPKKNHKETSTMTAEVRDAIVSNVSGLINRYIEDIMSNVEESKNGKVVVGFPTELDFSESEPVVTTKIRFATTVTDKKVSKLENPAQLRLFTPRVASEEDAAVETNGDGAGEVKDEKTRRRVIANKPKKKSGKSAAKKTRKEKKPKETPVEAPAETAVAE